MRTAVLATVLCVFFGLAGCGTDRPAGTPDSGVDPYVGQFAGEFMLFDAAGDPTGTMPGSVAISHDATGYRLVINAAAGGCKTDFLVTIVPALPGERTDINADSRMCPGAGGTVDDTVQFFADLSPDLLRVIVNIQTMNTADGDRSMEFMGTRL